MGVCLTIWDILNHGHRHRDNCPNDSLDLGSLFSGTPICFPSFQWEFQDPKMQVLYHIRPYFVGIFPYIVLT